MADPMPSVNSQDDAGEKIQNESSENAPLEAEQRSRTASIDVSDLDALAAEFNDAEKAVIENEPADDDEKLAPRGSICEVKEIYDTQTSNCRCCTEWVDEKPDRDRTGEKEAAEDKRAQFSVIRRMKAHGAGGWKTDSILINSRRIQAALAKVFEGYPVTYADDHNLVLYPGFIPFCHRWDKLLQVERDEPEAETKSHLTLLRSTLETELAHSLERRDLVSRTGFASFSDVVLVFEPEQIVIHRPADGILTAGRVREVTLEEPPFEKSYYAFKVDITFWNGEQFGVYEQDWRLNDFRGTKKIHGLDIFPLHMHPDHEGISRRLVERGKKYERLRGQHFLTYDGKVDSKHIRDRVIVDEEGKWDLADYYLPDVRPFDQSTNSSVTPCKSNHSSNNNSTEDTANTEGSSPSNTESTDPAPLTNDQLLLAGWCVSGFSLKAKEWHDLAVDHIQEIDWIPDLMSRLVLDQDTKELIVALVDYKTTHATDDKQIFDDFVPGKGKGIVMLLCGPPGVGKTLTAEAVSEHSKSPLYRVNVNDLGSNVSALEEGLQTAMKRCSRWNAVLLLDEADVFLEERSINSLERNELVSIFLRELEYYQGIMILTTNRAAAIDPAFESRIDVTLTFEPLPKVARRQIWDGFLAEANPPAQISDEDRDRLADWELNGRQIKSAVKTASIFASKQGGPMTVKHLDVVIKLRNSSGAMIGSKMA